MSAYVRVHVSVLLSSEIKWDEMRLYHKGLNFNIVYPVRHHTVERKSEAFLKAIGSERLVIARFREDTLAEQKV